MNPKENSTGTAGGAMAYTADHLVHDASRLFWLMDTVNNLLGDLDYGAGGHRNPDLDRIAAMADLALYMTKTIRDGAENAYSRFAAHERAGK